MTSAIESNSQATAYNMQVVKQFAVMTVVWGIVGMGVGVFIAAQMIWPDLHFNQPWLSFGRLRPLHTNAVIFAFGGSALFASSLYVVQRTCQVRLISDALASIAANLCDHVHFHDACPTASSSPSAPGSANS